jgi:hypothetical protein
MKKSSGVVSLFIAGSLFVLIFTGTSPIINGIVMVLNLYNSYKMLKDLK